MLPDVSHERREKGKIKMKVKSIQVKTRENNHVHFDRGRNIDTLCGLYYLGDETLGIHRGKEVNRKVNCPACIEIVRLCQTIQKSRYV